MILRLANGILAVGWGANRDDTYWYSRSHK